jgi:hypothetical protein
MLKKKSNSTSCHALIIKIYLPTCCENEDHKPICNYWRRRQGYRVPKQKWKNTKNIYSKEIQKIIGAIKGCWNAEK